MSFFDPSDLSQDAFSYQNKIPKLQCFEPLFKIMHSLLTKNSVGWQLQGSSGSFVMTQRTLAFSIAPILHSPSVCFLPMFVTSWSHYGCHNSSHVIFIQWHPRRKIGRERLKKLFSLCNSLSLGRKLIPRCPLQLFLREIIPEQSL